MKADKKKSANCDYDFTFSPTKITIIAALIIVCLLNYISVKNKIS